MTTPGPVERVPLKVVPYYVQPDPDEPGDEPEYEVHPDEPAARRRTILVGIGAAVLAAAVIALTSTGVVVGAGGDLVASTALAYAAIVVSLVAVVVSLVAIVGGFGRRWGVAALLVAVLANPLVLLTVLDAAERLQTGG